MARLVFYSGEAVLGGEKVDQELQSLLDKPNATVGYIPAAGEKDYRHFQAVKEHYAHLGMQCSVYCELDNAFYPDILNALWACDAIHLGAGNAFYFLYWLQARKLLDPIRDYARREGVLIGVDAGAILLTPDIGFSSICGNEPVEPHMDLTGLRLVPFSFVPGCQKIPKAIESIRSFSRIQHRTFYCCQDGDGLVVRGDELISLGQVVRVENGELIPFSS